VASLASSARSIAPKRLGCEEPRVFTPPLRKLTPKTSLGFACVEFSEEVLGVELFPWQKWLLIHMLELLPDESLRFRTVIVLVARQNGKSTLSIILSLFFMFVLARDLVIGTAQDLDVAEEIWQGAVDIVEDTPELNDLKERVVKVNGKKSLELKTGERYKVKAANRRAGRGLSGDLVLLDELREHQSWDAWGAITKTTMARAFALIVALSNAGDASSIVLRYLRKMAHLALGDPDGINKDETASDLAETADDVDLDTEDDSLAIFEWSAPPGCEIWDRDGWAMANPSLGHSITERTVASAAKTDPEWIFRTEVLCQWSEGTLEGPFPPGSWEASGDDESKRAEGAEIALCVETTWDRSTTFIGLASTRADGLHHVELIAQRAHTDWVIPWLTSPDRSEAVLKAPVCVQAKGAPASSLVEDMRAAGVNVVEWGGADLPNGTGNFYDAVRSATSSEVQARGVRHRNDPVLNLSAATTVPKLTEGGAFMWDRKKSQAASPLLAVTGALWCLLNGMPAAPKTSAYETRGVLTV
jgi:hypothetical protein